MANESALEQKLDDLNLVIAAAEDWGKGYRNDPPSHAKLIKLEVKFARDMRRHFRALARERIDKYINWTAYHTQVIQAYDIKVIFDEEAFSETEDGLLLNVLHDPILDGYGIGIEAAKATTGHDTGLSQTSASIQKAAMDHSAKLVSEINQTSKDRISQSIQSSLKLGEDYQTAAARLSDVINDPARALMIARTESVASFNQGLVNFGSDSGATGKVWDDVGAIDECAGNTADGQIPFDDSFSSGDSAPPAHPNAVFAGSSFASYGNLDEIVAADYDGPGIRIKTLEDYDITIGPNHPMLTQRGLVKASELTVSDYLVYDMRINDMSSVSAELNLDKIPMVEDVFNTVISKGGQTLVATAAHDLHGDRVFCKGEIKVVKPTNGLLSVFDSGGIEQFRKGIFVGADMKPISLPSHGSGDLAPIAIDLPAPSGMSGRLTYYRLMRIMFIHSVNYKGKAFDATTQSSLYNSGGFVVSNCRCSMQLIYPTGDEQSAQIDE